MVKRCYLSSEGALDYHEARCQEAYRPDMQDDFKFFGEALGTHQIPEQEKAHSFTIKLSVPGHWIVAAAIEKVEDGSWREEARPVPF